MKKSLLALAALTAFAGAASAQSSVTLFGIVDAGLARISHNGKSVNGMTNSGYNSSRLGFRGVEDLGGGLQAGFWLEASLSNDDGNATSALAFQRRSYIHLGGAFGEIRLGREYTPTFWNTTVYDVFGTNGIGSSMATNMIGANGNTVAGVRANNSISYLTPALGGFSVLIMKSFGEGLGSATTSKKLNDYLGARIGFAGGPVSVHGAFGKTEGATDAADVKYINFGASFDAGMIKPMIFIGQEKNGAGLKVRGIEGSVGINVGAGQIKAAYSTYSTNSVAYDDWKKLAVGYHYNMSKRTTLYTTVARVTNKGTQNKMVTAAGLAGPAAVAGKNSSGVEFGIRHSF